MTEAEKLMRAERLMSGFCPNDGDPMIFDEVDRCAVMHCKQCGFFVSIELAHVEHFVDTFRIAPAPGPGGLELIRCEFLPRDTTSQK